MDKASKIQLVRVEGYQATIVSDLVARETKLTIFVNQKKRITLHCSPGDEQYLAIGFLFTTGILSSKEDIVSMNTKGKIVYVQVKEPSSCFQNSTKPYLPGEIFEKFLQSDSLNPITDNNNKIGIPMIYALISQMQERAVFFKQTGGVHNSALADTSGRILQFSEDISRYNTIDKIMGKIVLHDMKTYDKILLASCRITSGIIKKLMVSHIPLMIARSAPTDEAIRLANKKGMTLIGFARGKRMNIYTHPKRLAI